MRGSLKEGEFTLTVPSSSREREDGFVRPLTRLSGPNVGPHSAKGVGVALTSGPCEDVKGGHQLNVYEPSSLDGVQVLSLQESAANSSRPQVHVGLGAIGHRLMQHDIRQIEPPAGLEGADNLGEDPVLVRTEVDHAVGDNDIHRGVGHR